MKVETVSGDVEGIAVGDAVAWRGIPYAAPPVGDLRYRPPQPASRWSGVRRADRYSAQAIQQPTLSTTSEWDDITKLWAGTHQFSFDSSEDCLYVNVCSPSTSGRRPVLVWLHGGGLTILNGPVAIGDGAGFVKHDIVVVSFNYRMGALGFLDLSSFLGEDFESSGNLGFLDQIAALRWVKENIAAFGGDPDQVTIAGHSAGARCVP